MGDPDRTPAVDRQRMLLEAGLALSSELSLPAVLRRIVELAMEVSQARYGALGVLGPDGMIDDFVTIGVTEEQRRAIGDLPHGHGILGALIADPHPLRLDRITDDPRSVGFPPNHPPMKTFLGAPVTARGRVYGNIYLTEKRGGEPFTRDDEEALVVLATQAGVAVDNASLYAESRRRERWLEAFRTITTSALAGSNPDQVFELVAQEAMNLVEADIGTVAMPSDEPGMLELRAAAGQAADELRGMTFSVEDSISGEVIQTGRSVVLADASRDGRVYQPAVQRGDMGPLIAVPLSMSGRVRGTLIVANRLGSRPFAPDDLDIVESFASPVAVALEYARAQEQLSRLAVMDDRERIAKELHDGVIQSLFAVGMGLQGTAVLSNDPAIGDRITGAVGELDRVIRDLRNYIFGLRPGILADRQLDQALRALADDFSEKTGVLVVVEVDAAVAADLGGRAGDVVQMAREALSNVGRHAEASTARLTLRREGGDAILEVDDDGKGFDPAAVNRPGHGIRNLRDRAAGLGGDVGVASTVSEGTTVTVRLPVRGGDGDPATG